MIELEESAWKKYEHAYGGAEDIPSLLKKLSDFPESENYQSEPFFSLWSSLCHQGDIYSASYAAVPHIVSCIEKNPSKAEYNYFLLPVCIEIARANGYGPSLDEDVEGDYKIALNKLVSLVSKITDTNETYSMVLSATVAVCNGNIKLGEAILELTPDVIEEFWEWFRER